MKICKYTLSDLINLPQNDKQLSIICGAIEYNLSHNRSKTMAGLAQHILVRNDGSVSFNKVVGIVENGQKRRIPITQAIGEKCTLGKFEKSDFKDVTAELKLIEFIEKRNNIIKKFFERFEPFGGVNTYIRKNAEVPPTEKIETPEKEIQKENKKETKNENKAFLEKVLDIAPIISDLPRDKQKAILEALCAK